MFLSNPWQIFPADLVTLIGGSWRINGGELLIQMPILSHAISVSGKLPGSGKCQMKFASENEGGHFRARLSAEKMLRRFIYIRICTIQYIYARDNALSMSGSCSSGRDLFS